MSSWESEIDHLSMPWATVRMVQLFSCQKSTPVFTLGSAGEAQSEGTSGGPQEVDVDELVMVREGIHLGLRSWRDGSNPSLEIWST